MHADNEEFCCRVCGYRETYLLWGADGHSPEFDYCECCGVEHGYQDSTPSGAKRFRDRWIADGARWMGKNKKPSDWNLQKQLANVPKKFKFAVAK